MEQIILIGFVMSGMVLMVLNVGARAALRTVNRWAREIEEYGKIKSGEASEIGTIYSVNLLGDCGLEIGSDDKYLILRNEKIRNKIREYRKLNRIRNILMFVYLTLLGMYIAFWVV